MTKKIEVAIATNGASYELNLKSRTAKKLEDPEKAFYDNVDISALDAELANHNTKVMYQLIKPYFDDAVRKHNSVHVMDFKISYASHGYKIIDLRNSGVKVNNNDYHNDFASPESVLKYLQKMKGKDRSPKVTVTREEVTAGDLMKLQSLGKVKITRNEKTNVMEVQKVIPEKTLPRLLTDVLRLFENYKNNKYKPKDMKERLIKRLPDVLHKAFTTLLSEYNKEVTSYRKVAIQSHKLIEGYLAEKNKVVVKPPKFEGVDYWEPIELVIETANLYGCVNTHTSRFKSVIEYKDEVTTGEFTEGTFKIHDSLDIATSRCIDPDIMWMRFKTKGPSGNLYDVECTLEEYLAMLVLHYFPKALTVLNTAARGEKVDLWGLSMKTFIKDEMEVFNRELLRHPEDRTYFCMVCRFILNQGDRHDEAIATCFDYVYNSGYKKGDKVNLMLSDEYQWHKVIVISDKGEPMEVRFEDGSTVKVVKYNKVLPEGAFN